MSDAKLIIKPPHMEVRMKAGYWPDLPKMQQTIQDAGYKPIEGSVAMRVTGKLVKEGDRLSLELDGMKSPITLPLVASKESPDLLAQLGARSGETVELEGQWSAEPTGTGTLAVTTLYRNRDKGGTG